MPISCTNSCKKPLYWSANSDFLRFRSARINHTLAVRFSKNTIFASVLRFFLFPHIRLGAAACLLLFVTAPAFSQEAKPASVTTPTLPEELMFNGKPIDPLCFEAVSADEWLDVSKCTDDDVVKVDGMPSEAFANRIGYQYHFKDVEGTPQAYSYYEYVGSWNGAPVIMTYANGGGNGRFSALISIERNAGKIRVLQGFAAGDRCNGGITDVKLEQGTLAYGQWISPFDFLQMVDDNPADLRAYDDLDASASSCYGVARYKDGELSGISLVMEERQNLLGDTPENTQKSSYQKCFNELYSTYLAQGKKDLSIQQLKEFTGEFNRLCITDEK